MRRSIDPPRSWSASDIYTTEILSLLRRDFHFRRQCVNRLRRP